MPNRSILSGSGLALLLSMGGCQCEEWLATHREGPLPAAPEPVRPLVRPPPSTAPKPTPSIPAAPAPAPAPAPTPTTTPTAAVPPPAPMPAPAPEAAPAPAPSQAPPVDEDGVEAPVDEAQPEGTAHKRDIVRGALLRAMPQLKLPPGALQQAMPVGMPGVPPTRPVRPPPPEKH